MSRFHVNPATGRTGKCDAKKACPFGDDAPHSDTREGAQAAYEAYVAEDDDPATNELATFSKRDAKEGKKVLKDPGSPEAMKEKLLGPGSAAGNTFSTIGDILALGEAQMAANRKASEHLVGTTIGETNGGQPVGVPAYAPVEPTGIRALFGADPKDPWDEEVKRKFKEGVPLYFGDSEVWPSRELEGPELREYIYRMQGEQSKFNLDATRLRKGRSKGIAGGGSYENDARGKRMAAWLNESRFLGVPHTRFGGGQDHVFMSKEFMEYHAPSR